MKQTKALVTQTGGGDMKSILLAKDTTPNLSCKSGKMRNVLTILTASFTLLVLSFTFSSCKKCSKDQPGRDGNTNNKPIDLSTLKQQIQCQLGKMAAQLVVARNAAKEAKADDFAVTGKSMNSKHTVFIAVEPEIENAKRLAKMADNANTEAQNFAVTADQKEAAQADPEAMILVKAVELVLAQITAQVASTRDSLKHILHMQAFNVAMVAWYALDSGDSDERNRLKHWMQVEHWYDDWNNHAPGDDPSVVQGWLKRRLQMKYWYDDASEKNWNKVDQDALELTNNMRKKINDMKISSQAQLKTNKTWKLAAQESKKASDAAEKLEGEVGQAVLDMVKAAVTQAEK